MEEREQCGRFTLVRPIGRGGMGEIFEARDEAGQTFAIKRLLSECARDPLFVGMFLDEARLVEGMRHPNVCDVYEHGLDAGSHYFLAMEYVDGPSLAGLIKERGALPAGLALRIVAEVASALDYAHRLTDEHGELLGIVHRDVNPSNIVVGRDGRVVLVDFGLAKARTQIMKTAPGLVKGKFGYLAPEQLGGHVDWRTDLFALGLCLIEAIEGRQFFRQSTAAATVQAIRAFQGPPPAGAGPAVDALLARALAPAPSDRFASAADFRAAVGSAAQTLGDVRSAEDLADFVRGAEARPSAGSADLSASAVTALPARSNVGLVWLFVALGLGLVALVGALLALG